MVETRSTALDRMALRARRQHVRGEGPRHRSKQCVHDPLPPRLDLTDGNVVGEVMVALRQRGPLCGDQIAMLVALNLDARATIHA